MAKEHSKKYISFFVPYVTKARQGEQSESHETGDILPEKVLGFLQKSGARGLELKRADGSKTTVDQHMQGGDLGDFVKVVLPGGVERPFSELSALSVLRASATCILLAEALDYLSCVGKTTSLDARYLGTLCSNLEDIVRLNDELWLEESRSLPAIPAPPANTTRSTVGATGPSMDGATSLWSHTQYKQSSATEHAFMSFLLDIHAERIFCFLATEVVKLKEQDSEEKATAAIRLSIRFLLMGAEIAVESKARGKRSGEEQDSIQRFCSECLVLSGRYVGNICSKYPVIDMESWLIAAEDFCEGCSFRTANVHVSLFCGMMNALEIYSLDTPISAACKRALLMLLRLISPHDETLNRFRKANRARSLQSPEQLASRLIGTARARITLDDVVSAAKDLIPEPSLNSSDEEIKVGILPAHPTLEHIFNICGRFLQGNSSKSDDSCYALLKLLSTVMETAAARAQSFEPSPGAPAHARTSESSTISSQFSLQSNVFLEPPGTQMSGGQSSSESISGFIHLEIVNLSVQSMTILIDFIPQKATTSLFEFYSSLMRTSRLLPLERLGLSMASVLSSRLRTLLLSVPRGDQDPEIMSQCHSKVIDAFIEEGPGGLQDVNGARHESFFVAYFVLKSERDAVNRIGHRSDFVTPLLNSFSSMLEENMQNGKPSIVSYPTLLLIAYAYNALQSSKHRGVFVARTSAMIERAVKVLNDNRNRRNALRSMLTLLNIVDYCTYYFNSDFVPGFLENEIENEIFRSLSSRGVDGTERLQQLMATNAQQEKRDVMSVGPTSSCMETLLDMLCANLWDLPVGQSSTIENAEEIADFSGVCWRLLKRVPRGVGSSSSAIDFGLTSQLNSLRNGDLPLSCEELSESHLKTLSEKVCQRDCIWVSSFTISLIQSSRNDNSEVRSSTILSIIEVVDKLFEMYPDLLKCKSEEIRHRKPLTEANVHDSCLISLDSAVRDSGYSSLLSTILILVGAAVDLGADIQSEVIVRACASLAGKLDAGSELHHLLLTLARTTMADSQISMDSIQVIFSAHRLARHAGNCAGSPVAMEQWLQLVENIGSNESQGALGSKAASLVFGGVGDKKILNLVPRSSLTDTLLQLCEANDIASASRMLAALDVLLSSEFANGWSLAMQQTVLDICRDASILVMITSFVLSSAKAATSLVSIFEKAGSLDTETVKSVFRALSSSAVNPSTSSVNLLNTIDLMMVIAMKEARISDVRRLVRSYYDLLSNLWDAEKLRPRVLQADLKSCILVQRLRRIYSSLAGENLESRSLRDSSLEMTLEQERGAVANPSEGSADTENAEQEATEAEETSEEEEDELSPAAIASKCCTFTETGRQFVEQHWYYCYTCGMTWGEGICRICALVCHKDHEVSYSRLSRFFCDCGAGASDNNSSSRRTGGNGTTRCIALQPRPIAKPTSSAASATAEAIAATEEQESASAVVGRANAVLTECPTVWSEDELSRLRIQKLLRTAQQSQELRDVFLSHEQTRILLIAARGARGFSEGRLFASSVMDLKWSQSSTGTAEVREDVVNIRCSARPGTIVLKKPEQEPQFNPMAYCGSGVVAVADPSGKLLFYNVKQVLSGSDLNLDSSSVKCMFQAEIPPGVLTVEANEENPTYLLLKYPESVYFLQVDDKVEYQQAPLTELERVDETFYRVSLWASWVKGFQSIVAVADGIVIAFYDVSESLTVPIKVMDLQALGVGDIKDMSLCRREPKKFGEDLREEQRLVYITFLTTKDNIYAGEIDLMGGETPEVQPFQEVVAVGNKKPVSVDFSRWTGSAIIGLVDGSLLLHPVDTHEPEVRGSVTFESVFPAAEKGIVLESIDGPDFFMKMSRGSNGSVELNAVRIVDGVLHRHDLTKALAKSNSKVVGTVFCEAASRGVPEKPSGLILLEDGSLHGFVLLSEDGVSLPARPKYQDPEGATHSSEISAEQIPSAVGFFEKCRQISDQVVLGGDILNCDGGLTQDEARLAVWGPGGDCIVAPVPNAPFKFRISVRSRTVFMTGIRMLFGSCERSRTRVPAKINVFGRCAATLSQGSRRWIDIPFSAPESAASPRDVTVELIPHNDRSSEGNCAFDALDVYGVSVSEFSQMKAVFEKKMKRIKRERSKQKKKAIHRQQAEDRVRFSALQKRGSPDETLGISVIAMASLSDSLMDDFLSFLVELEHDQERSFRIQRACREVLERKYTDSALLERLVTRKAIEKLCLKASRLFESRRYSPREIEDVLLTAGRLAEENEEQFLEVITEKDPLKFSRTIFLLHQSVQNSGRRVLYQAREGTVGVLRVLCAVFKVLTSIPDRKAIAVLVFTLLTHNDGDIRRASSKRLAQMISEVREEGGDGNDEILLAKLIIQELLEVFKDRRSKDFRKKLKLFDAISFLHRQIAETLEKESALQDFLDTELLKSCLLQEVSDDEIWFGKSQCSYENAFLLLRLAAVTASTESFEKEIRRTLFWSEELFVGLARLLERLWPTIEVDFSSSNVQDSDDFEGEPDASEAARASCHISTDGPMESLVSKDILESVILSNRSQGSSSFALLAAESVLQLLQSLWPLRDHVSEDCISQLRRTSCVYAHIFKHKVNNISTFWTNMLKSTSRLSKSLLHLLCNLDRDKYYSELDKNFYWQRLKNVRGIFDRLEEAKEETPYEEQVEMADCLSGMLSLAAKRPWNWRTFCKSSQMEEKDLSTLQLLLRVASCFGNPLLLHSMRLLAGAYAFSNEDSLKILSDGGPSAVSDGATSAASDESKTSPPSTKDGDDFQEWREKNMYRLNVLIREYCLGNNSPEVRQAATEIVRGLFLSSKENDVNFHRELQALLLQWIPSMVLSGQNCEEFSRLVASCASASKDDPDYCRSVCVTIVDVLKKSLKYLSVHPNAHLYKALNEVLALEGFFFESELCALCAYGLEDKSSKMTRLDSIRAETKYTDRAILCRLQSQQSVSAVSVKIVHTGRSCRVRAINILYSCRPVTEVSELKSYDHPWKASKSIKLALRQAEARITFPIPVVASNLMFEFAEFHATDGDGTALNERLSCPRCSRTVSDRHGICRNCHENAYQCRQCRNINYENLDAFICNECGYCKHGKFEFSLQCAPSFAAERINSETDRLRTVGIIEKEMLYVHEQYEHLQLLREMIQRFIGSSFDNEKMVESAMELANYEAVDRSADETDLESPLATILSRLSRAEADDEGAAVLLDRSLGIGNSSGSIGNRRSPQFRGSNLLSRRTFSSSTPAPTSKVNQRTALLANAYGKDCSTVFTALSRSIQGLTAMRAELLRYASGARDEDRMSPSCSSDSARCFGCSTSFVMKCVELIGTLLENMGDSKDTFVESNLCMILLENDEILQLCGASSSTCKKVVSTIAISSKASLVGFIDRLSSKLSFCTSILKPLDVGSSLAIDMDVLEYISNIGTREWEEPFRVKLLPYFLKAGDMRTASLAEHVVLPFLRILKVVSKRENNGVESLTKLIGDADLTQWGLGIAIHSPSGKVRKETTGILKTLHRGDTKQLGSLLARLADEPLSLTSNVGENSAEFFDCIEELLDEAKSDFEEVHKDLLPSFAQRIAKEAEMLQEAEARLDRFRFSQGYVLRRLTWILTDMVEKRLREKKGLLQPAVLISSVLQAYLSVRKLVVQRTLLTDFCASALLALLKSMDVLDGNQEVLRIIVRRAVQAKRDEDNRSLGILLEQLRETLCPAKPEPVYQIVFHKSITQEEYIRGNLSRSPYPSAKIGKKMRDVKNKICRDLDLTGLRHDDFGLELIVAGNLLSLDLTIRSVYEHVWRPYQARNNAESGSGEGEQADSPMIVMYRLSGLDGEATEPIIDSLEEPVDTKLDPEVELASTAVLADTGGLDLLLEILRGVENWNDWNKVCAPALELLYASCQIRSNRLILANRETVSTLLECSAGALASEDEDAGKAAEVMLSLSARILAEYEKEAAKSEVGESERSFLLDDNDVLSLVDVFICRLDQSSSTAETALLEVLPFICREVVAAQQKLIDYFLSRQDLTQMNSSEDSRVIVRLSHLLKAASTPQDEYIRSSLMQQSLGNDCRQYLQSHFPLPRSENSSVWETSLSLNGPVLILKLLAGLTKNAQNGSDSFKQRVVDCLMPLTKILTTLETVTSASAIGAEAEELLEEVMTLPEIEEEVKKLRKEIKDQRKAAAAARRNAVLLEAGVIPASETAGLTLQPQLSAASVPECIQMDGIEEELGPTCVVCRDGFTSRPDEVLSLYVYNKRIWVPVSQLVDEETLSDSSIEGMPYNAVQFHAYTTVTHFNAIHASCHREAVRVDRSMRQPRDEWEGATVRNSQTKCNNLLPMEPPVIVPSATEEAAGNAVRSSNRSYSEAVDQYFLRMYALGDSGLNEVQVVVKDLATSLLRFASRDSADFARDTRGGGAHSNASLIPYFIQLALYLASSHEEEFSTMLAFLNMYLLNGGDGVCYFLAMSVCYDDLATWMQRAPVFLKHAFQEQERVNSLSLIAFTYGIQAFLKKGLGADWKVDFRRRLVSDDCMTSNTRQLIKYYERHVIEDNESFLVAVRECVEAAGAGEDQLDALKEVVESTS